MKEAIFIGLPIRKNQTPAAKWCKSCGRKHSRRQPCLLVQTESGTFRDIETDKAINAYSRTL